MAWIQKITEVIRTIIRPPPIPSTNLTRFNAANGPGNSDMNSVSSNQHLSTPGSAHSSGSSEQNTDDELIFVNSVGEPESKRREDHSNTSFSDWHFVEKSTENNDSDDDSIVIIERELYRPVDSASVTDNESDNDEIDHFTDVGSDSHCTDKNVRSAESPLYYLFALPDRQLFNQMTESKLFYCLITYLTVVAVLAIGIVYSTKSSTTLIESNTLTELQSSMRLQKTFIDDLFAYQVEMLNHVKRISDDVYSLNIRQFAQTNQQVMLPAKENPIINLLDLTSVERPQCEKDIDPKLLPIVCLEIDDVILLLTKEQLISAFNDVVHFLQETGHKYSSLDDSLIHALSTKPITVDEKATKDLNSFAQDCDSFSKNYRLNFCSKTDDSDSCIKNAEGVCVDENAFSFDKNSEPELEDKTEAVTQNTNDNKKVTEEFREFIKKFKDDFEHLYRAFMREIDREKMDFGENEMGRSDDKSVRNESEENIIESLYIPRDESNENSTLEVETVESNRIPEDVDKTTTTGEWLLILNAARGKLREYYDRATQGNWFLELGKARERWRTGHEDEKQMQEETEKPFTLPHKDRSTKKEKPESSDYEERKERSNKSEDNKRKKNEKRPWYKVSWEDSRKWFEHENKPWHKVWDSYKKWYRKENDEVPKTDDEDDERQAWFKSFKMPFKDSKKWFKKGDKEQKPWYKKSWDKYKGWFGKETDDENSWYSWYKKPAEDTREWYNKYDSKKMKNDFKKFTTKCKSHFNKLKDGFLDNYEKYVPSYLQIDLRNMW